MNAIKKAWLVLGAFGLALAMSLASQAQVNSGASTINLSATLGESVSVVTGPASITFPLVPSGTAAGNNPATITTSWALAKTRTSLKVYAYFASANALTDGAGDNIPNTAVSGAVDGAAAAPFTGATPYGGAFGMTVFSQAIGAAGTFNSSHADTIALTINTTGLGLPANTYTGVLNIQAQAL
jgi:hypothetical protein